MADAPTPSDPFAILRRATAARVGLGRAGQGLPTAPMLAFQLAQARARDAVHATLDLETLRTALGGSAILVQSAAPDRAAYLADPDLGRRLAPATEPLPHGEYDLALVIADGLSATAVQAHAGAVVAALRARLASWSIAPLVVARQARVALGDPIGEGLGAQLVVVLIGERPGLSAADSLGAYITFDPKPGRRDSERNCVSNIRAAGGLSPDEAAGKIAWLLIEAQRLGFTGVDLKDREALPAPTAHQLPTR
ncbi:ethanolamine ammonia-lyase subunit EutC [Phenylobacterium sp.]|jgi:ethanolamine ammonia-lyase small subunit|uniref:ethanolamine ammonia-lyase subunit EutC n=1 Tax=Phenylobacterium sp. TaxID=1871053 RepID=UPI0012020472|nr:ethanolamine ammonia-lyase subunit EutC [Phenylobacterium sp.]THD54865.1 MAG: ethanolamine ammonia-lyase subunit EutC [Phenylobacterium sp.]